MTQAVQTAPDRVLAQLRAIDELVRASDHAGALGWDEQQEPGRYAPAIEHSKTVFHAFVRLALAHGPLRQIVQVGLGGPARHAALRCLAERVVTIEADPKRLRDFAAGRTFDARVDALLCGDPTAAAVSHEVADLVGQCDLLLIDRDCGAQDVLACWRQLAPLVRDGGLVAIVDRSQEFPEVRRGDDVDQFVQQLEQRFLAPQGRPLQRFVKGHAIFAYARREADDEQAFAAAWPMAPEGGGWRALASPSPQWSLFEGRAGCRAVLADIATYSDRQRVQHRFPLVLCAADSAQLHQRLGWWQRLEHLAASGQRQLCAGDLAGFERTASAARELATTFAPWLEEDLQSQPHSGRLLRTAGVWYGLVGELDLCVGLLGRHLDAELRDGEVVQLLAQVHLLLRGDGEAARQLLAKTRRRLAHQQRMRQCLQEPHAHSLWGQPSLLQDQHRVLWVGADGAAASHACARLGLAMTWLPNGNASQRAEPAARVLQPVVAGNVGEVTLWHDPQGRVCLRAPSSRFVQQLQLVPPVALREVAATTLDELLGAGVIEAAAAAVLVVDVPGDEAAILQAAPVLLASVQVICVAVHHPCVFDTPPHQELLRWLERAGFAYVGAEATTVGHRAMTFLQRVC